MYGALWIAQKNQLCYLIKQVSDLYGGDEVEWLREYAKDAIEANKDCLGEAISCFQYLSGGYGEKSLKTINKAVLPKLCGGCGYVVPFCRFDLKGKCTNI